MVRKLHRDELALDEQLVRHLVDTQFPQYRGLNIQPLQASGSSNLLYRLGRDLLVRLPRQPGAGTSVFKEHKWLPLVRDKLPVQVPEIVWLGTPTTEFSEYWAITDWLDGELVTSANASNRDRLASDLADVILALRAIHIPSEALNDKSLRWYRGDALASFDPMFHKILHYCRRLDGLELDFDTAELIWRETISNPSAQETKPDAWFHSDLVAENLLLQNGSLSSVLDFGSLSIGDPTIDLHGSWELFDANGREVFRNRLAASDEDWLRGKAWALAIGLGALAYYWRTMPKRVADRLTMVQNVLSDPMK